MSQPLHIHKAFTQGYLVEKRLDHNETIRPAKGYAWLLLNGFIGHITGSNTNLYFISKFMAGNTRPIVTIDTAEPSAIRPMFNVEQVTGGKQSQWVPIILTHNEGLFITGNVAEWAVFQFLEWRI